MIFNFSRGINHCSCKLQNTNRSCIPSYPSNSTSKKKKQRHPLKRKTKQNKTLQHRIIFCLTGADSVS